MSTKWSDHTLKYQLNTIFLNITFWSLIVIGISCVIFQYIYGVSTHDKIANNFEDFSKNDMIAIVSDGANFFDEKLAKLTSNFPNLMKTSFEDSYRTDYPFGYIKSYYNWPNTFVNEQYSSVYNANISYTHSSYNVYGKTINDISGLPQNMQKLINVTSSTDYLFVPSFNYSSDFFAGYVATPSQFLRYYPAAINYQKVNNYINYNNLNDYWYQEIMSNTEDVTYTSPYYDSIARQLMITIGSTVKNPNDGSIIGAFGSDLILKTIQNDIKNLIYLNKSRTILFEKETGYVIADSFQTLKSLMTYENLTDPSFKNVWNKLKNMKLVDLNGYYYVAVDMKTSNAKYMLVSSIEKQYVTSQYDHITDDINLNLQINIYTVVGVFIGMLFLISALTYFLTNRIVTPIQQLSEYSKQLTQNIGERELTHGINTEIARSGIREVDELTYQFSQSIATISAQPVESNNVNSYYQNIPWMYNSYPLPSAPIAHAYVVAETKESEEHGKAL